MLEFCPVCKGLLLVKKEGGKNIAYCKCGFKRKSGVEISSSEVNKNQLKGAELVKDESSKGFIHKCSKCGYKYSEVKDLGEVLDNEESVFLYTCKKCGHVDRESGGA